MYKIERRYEKDNKMKIKIVNENFKLEIVIKRNRILTYSCKYRNFEIDMDINNIVITGYNNYGDIYKFFMDKKNCYLRMNNVLTKLFDRMILWGRKILYYENYWFRITRIRNDNANKCDTNFVENYISTIYKDNNYYII